MNNKSKKRKFSIFRVYDYKGGELSSDINLDEEDFYEELEKFFDLDDVNTSEMTVKEIESLLIKIESAGEDGDYEDEDEEYGDFYSTYAGGGGFCGEIYEHIGSDLVGVSIYDFLPQIAERIKKKSYENEKK